MVPQTPAADSHPIHLHQIKLEVVKRCLSNEVATFSPGNDVLGSEKGWKDAVIAYPNVDADGEPVEGADGPIGRSTFIRMKFDLLGIYGEPSSLQHMLCI